MSGLEPKRRRLSAGTLLLAGIAVLLFGGFWLADYHFGYRAGQGVATLAGPLDLLFELDASTLQNALSGLAQVIVAVLGIAITVVSIVVQLAATRYTPRIADLFFRDRTNLAIMGFFVVTCISAVWVSLSVSGQYVPRATVIMTTVIVTASLLLLLPYFAYVFDFLDPEKVILRIGEQALAAALGLRANAPADLPARQASITAALEHLADVAVNAVAQKDKVIASSALRALRGVLVRYLGAKPRLPDGWFGLAACMREDPDFIALDGASLNDLEAQRIWVEWKVLRHFRSVFAESLDHLPEFAHVVAIETRHAGEAAVAAGERAAATVVLKFFNTYLRTALNARHVRASYNVMSQYRQLAEGLLADKQDELCAEVGRRFAYYGQTAHALDLGFVTETAASDLAGLCERAFDHKARCHDTLLATFLEVDREPETSSGEHTLRGVRKAQVRLATYYLVRGAPEHARTIQRDMQAERPERLASIRGELASVAAKDFWEVTERGINFDYLEPGRRAKLDEFFALFRAAAPERE